MLQLFTLSILICAVLVSSQCTIELQLSSFDPLELKVIFSNPSSAPVRILQRGTPLEGVWTDMFDIRDEHNNRVEYIGKMVRRVLVPLESEYVNIPARGEVSTVIDLGQNYEFETGGKYNVTLDLPLYSQVVYTISGEQVVSFELKEVPKRASIAGPQGYTNCNSNQIAQIQTAISGSITESSRSVTCLTGRTCNTQSVEWFGPYDSANHNYDINVFRSVGNRLNNFDFNGYCNPAGCGNNVYGYVYPTDPTFTVYLCAVFWRLPEERVNTVVHEMSHFRSLGGSSDYAYGQTACRSLARSDPYRASRNADNICYFSETV